MGEMGKKDMYFVQYDRLGEGDSEKNCWWWLTFQKPRRKSSTGWCHKSGPLNVIGQFGHGVICWKTRVKFAISHWSVSIHLLLVKVVGFLVRLLLIKLSRSVKSPFVVFVSFMDK